MSTSYFKLRNVSPEYYKNYTLPEWLKREINNKEYKILDYGCGFGQTLKALRDFKCFNIYGLDIDDEAVSYCREQGLNVYKIDNSNIVHNPYPFRFDVIILLHVLEHIPKEITIDFLKKLKDDFLQQGGELLIAVPNAQSNTSCYWAYEDWTHTTLFTSGSIYYVLKAAGFEKIDFLDIDCTLGMTKSKALIRKFLLTVYKLNKMFWNKVTCSSYHAPSPLIFSYEIKVKAV